MTFATHTIADERFEFSVGNTIVVWLREQRDAWFERRRQMRAIRQMRGLSDHALRDIGIDRSEIVSAVIHGRSR